MGEKYKLILGDCLEKMKELPDESIDLGLTDPPYGLEFMGKEWDKWTDSFTEHWAEAVFPKLKVGAFLVFTMSPRQDLLWRCLAGLEKAGFVLGHSGMFWLYHTGFPKALDVSKAIDKSNSRTEKDYKELAEFLLKRRKDLSIPQKEIAKHFPSKTGGLTGCVSNWELGENVPTKKQWVILKTELKIETNQFDELIERVEAEREIIKKDERNWGDSGFGMGVGSWDVSKPINKTSKKWQGWKSFQLKPAVEAIVVAQKPRSQKTITGQVLDNGCGAVNIQECRIPYEDTQNPATNPLYRKNAGYKNMTYPDFNSTSYKLKKESSERNTNQQGRFPANLIVQGDPLKGESQGIGHFNSKVSVQLDSGSPNRFYSLDAWAAKRNITVSQNSAFLDVPKPSKAEKNAGLEEIEEKEQRTQGANSHNCFEIEGGGRKTNTLNKNNHPTCKPVTLFRYLATLFCQPKGLILDPFMGSGTTAIAALQENKRFIGIERNADYFEITKKRVEEFKKQTRL